MYLNMKVSDLFVGVLFVPTIICVTLVLPQTRTYNILSSLDRYVTNKLLTQNYVSINSNSEIYHYLKLYLNHVC